MTFEIFLMTVGISLLLLGFSGKIKTKLFEAGVEKRWLRVTVGVIGVLFIAAGFAFKPFPFMVDEEDAPEAKFLGGGKFLVEIKPIQTRESDEMMTWVKNTVERKLTEILHNSGHTVQSVLTEKLQTHTPNFIITGRAYRQMESISVDIYLSDHLGKLISQGSLEGDFQFFKSIRSVIDEVLIYALKIDKFSIKLESAAKRPTGTSRAFAHYLLGRDAIRKEKYQDAISQFMNAYQADARFAMACWTMSQVYGIIGNIPESKKWNAKAVEIHPDHPKWSYLDPRRETRPLPEIFKLSTKTPYREIAPGLRYKSVDVAVYNLRLAVWLIDPDEFDADIVMQKDPMGNHIEELFPTGACSIAINGGFFEMDHEHRLSPSGLVVRDGQVIHPVTDGGGSGVFYIAESGPRIDWSKNINAPESFLTAIQCNPLLIEPGGTLGIYSNDYERVNRSAIGLSKDRIAIALVEGKDGKGGLSLYEFAQFLLKEEFNGGVECDVALNLDGGSSTQVQFQCKDIEVKVKGLWALNNAIVFTERGD